MFSELITEEFKDVHEAAIDEVIRAFGANCRLIYKGGKWEPCPNCIVNPQTGKSTGIYKTGGPISFTTGLCPYCKSAGRIIEENTEDVTLGVVWDHKQFMSTVVPVDGNQIQTICRAEHYTKLKRASEIIADTTLQDYSRNIYQRMGDPIFAGFRNSFVICNWKRTS